MTSSAPKESVLSLQELPSGRSEVWCLRGYIAFHCLFGLSEVGFFDDLAARGTLDLNAYATEKQLNYDALDAVARYLYGLGILDRVGRGEYRQGVSILEQDLATVEMFYAYDPLFHDLTSVLRQEKVYGKDIHRFPGLDARATAKICRSFSYPRIIELIEKKGALNVLDLGCGSAEILIQLCKRNPGAKGYGIDIEPDAVKCAQKRIDEEGLADRIRIATGDILNLDQSALLNSLAVDEVDLVLSAAVFHEFAFDGVRNLIAALEGVKRKFNGVALMLSEALEQPDDSLRENPSFVLEHHLFHRLSLQGIASLDLWRSAFGKAGYQIEEESSLGPGGVIFVIK